MTKMSDNIANLFGVRMRGDVVGVEQEVECKSSLTLTTLPRQWEYHNDGSLRGNSAEFVSYPMSLDDTVKSMADLYSWLNKFGPIDDSPRTSMHVHVNMSDKTENQVFASLLLYWLLEDQLMQYCGKKRYNNLFTCRSSSADAMVMDLTEDCRNAGLVSGSIVHHYAMRGYKYSSINLTRIIDLGTIEYRGMDGRIDLDRNKTWVEQCMKVSRGHTYKDPAEVFDDFWADQNAFARRHILPGVIDKIQLGSGKVRGSLGLFAYSRDWNKDYKPTKRQRLAEQFFAAMPMHQLDNGEE